LANALVECMELSIAREKDEEIRYLQDAESSNPFLVYGREGEPCPSCAAPVLKEVQQGRSTFWCGICQA
jgi:formamidopyrimidine-DNA glycosylase